MHLWQRILLTVTIASCPVPLLQAQDLNPRAYVITPLRANAVTVGYAYFSGNLLFDGAVPITGATGKINITSLGVYRALNLFGRSANFTAALPYSVGNYHGTVTGIEASAYRSGLLDSSYRFAVNLKGGPAMDAGEFRKWQQKTLLGVSLKVVAPTGQYDPTKLLNNGSNRWAFKSEFGYSERWGHWVLDAYGAVWFFTANPEFYSHNAIHPGTVSQSQSPVGAFEGHLSYDVRARFWASLDGNYWRGGTTSLNGIANPATEQKNSRIGATVSVPLTKHQAVKFSYNDGAYISYGGNYQSVSAAWQYSWIGNP